MRLGLVAVLSGILGGCVMPALQQQVVQVGPSAAAVQAPASRPSAGRRIAYDGAGRFILPDGTVVTSDASGGFTLPNGVYVAPDDTGTLLLPNGARCVSDGAGGYVCPDR